MKYREYEVAFSQARLNKYQTACGGNKRKAMVLYRNNVKLCQKFYGVLNIFEIILRNAIDKHYRAHFNDGDWIIHQLQPGGMLEYTPHKTDALKHYHQLIQNKNYTPDRMMSAQSFGFWTYMFNKIPFNLGGKNLLTIFPNKQKGLGQRAVFVDLKEIKLFRNRIAHHEPICFDVYGNKNMANSLIHYKLIIKYLFFLGYTENEVLYGYDVKTQKLTQQIMRI